MSVNHLLFTDVRGASRGSVWLSWHALCTEGTEH